MGKISTLLKIAFFSALLAGFIFIQYNWVLSLQKDKQQDFSMRVLRGTQHVGQKISFHGPINKLTDNTIDSLFRQSFSSQGLHAIPVEFSTDFWDHPVTSRGFNQQLLYNNSHLVWYYVLPENKKLIVVVPFWERYAVKGMGWIIAALVLLTIVIMVLFCFAAILVERNQQLFYRSRTRLLKKMMQQLETPLSTVSVAAEALHNDQVMHDSRKINYYQQVINEENQRMNEQVNKMLQDLE